MNLLSFPCFSHSHAWESMFLIAEHYNPLLLSAYVTHLDRWLVTFPAEQILVVDGARLATKPWEEMERVEAFLGLENEVL